MCCCNYTDGQKDSGLLSRHTMYLPDSKQPDNLTAIRFHDLRHQAITELAESGASEQTIMAIAGHVSRRMLERYSHVRLEAKREALEALSAKKSEYYGTNYAEAEIGSEVSSFLPIKNRIGACGFEPQTPTVSRWARHLQPLQLTQ